MINVLGGENMWYIPRDDELYHYGVPGMRRGVRKDRSRAGMPQEARENMSNRLSNTGYASRTETRKASPFTNESKASVATRSGADVLAIKKKLLSNRRYKSSRVWMPSNLRG